MISFDPDGWLEVAEVCCDTIEGVDAEALLRTALNCAYYAALLSVKRRIESVHGRNALPRFRTHAAILDATQSGGVLFLEIYRSLQALRTMRESADYELRSEPLHWNAVHSQVRLSRNLIRTRIKALPDAEFRRLVLPRR
ncbi:MAG TPA: hypothetical protein VGO40_02990 [Longimicrobium sp.]|jgi:hypothetical protein|nr:hypothetical protein [Longimicrobium sp.]